MSDVTYGSCRLSPGHEELTSCMTCARATADAQADTVAPGVQELGTLSAVRCQLSDTPTQGAAPTPAPAPEAPGHPLPAGGLAAPSPPERVSAAQAEFIGAMRDFWTRYGALQADLACSESRPDEARQYRAEAARAARELEALGA